MNILLLTYVSTFLTAFFSLPVSVISEDRIHNSHETEFTAIYYYQEKVSANFPGTTQNNASILGKGYETGLISIKDNVDNIVYRVKQILGIYPPDLRFNINIYRTYSELTEVFRGMGLTGEVPAAFYSHKYKTIYISAEKLNNSILAHEIAHAVINSYFTPIPSIQVQEILAHYVEKNLKDPLTRNQSP